jgi:hypothetical protein
MPFSLKMTFMLQVFSDAENCFIIAGTGYFCQYCPAQELNIGLFPQAPQPVRYSG